MSITTSDMEIWFSTTGSDTTGTGTEANPYATYDKAMSVIPDTIDHKVIVKGKEGSYSCSHLWDKRECTRNGLFILEGADLPRSQGPFTVRTSTAIGIDPTDNSGWDIRASGVSWTTDEFYRAFVCFTSGEFEGACFPIFSNTTDTLKFCGYWGGKPAVNDTFIIYSRPSLQLRFERGATFTWTGHVGRAYSQFIISNVSFQVTTDMSIPGGYYGGPFVWDGNGNTLMAVTEFYGDNATWLFSHSAGLINLWGPYDDISLYMEHPELLMPDMETWMFYPSIQFVGHSTPPSSSDLNDIVCIDGSNNSGWTLNLANFSCRQGVYFETARAEVQYSMIAYAIADHGSHGSLGNCRISPIPNGTAYAVRVDDFSLMGLTLSWIDNCTGDGVLLTDGSRLMIVKTGGTTASITGYGVKAGALVKIRNEGNNTTLEGTSGKIRLTQSDTTVAWPTAKTSYNDGMGSFVTG